MSFWRILLTAVFAGFLLLGLVSRSPVSGQATSRGGERNPNANFDGVWDTTLGRVILAQSGTKVRGTYNPGGRIDGTVHGRILTFTWFQSPDQSEPENQGTGEFSMKPSHAEFEGTWRYESSSEDLEWNGVLAGVREVEGPRPDLDYCLWRGAWKTVDGAVAFSQEMESSAVTGEFLSSEGHGTIEGFANGWTFSFTWETPGDSGSGSVEMATDLSAFTGSLASETRGNLPWSGTFKSAALRQDFSGNWSTNLGNAVINEDLSSGVVSGSIGGATVDGNTGDLTFRGVVVGDTCSFDWTLTGAVTLNGRGMLEWIDESKLDGVWAVEGEEGMTRKLSGKRLGH
jgi:hypothetical protein